ncbi:hypothetical protein E4U11_000598, partial [Claviceps purpurea]
MQLHPGEGTPRVSGLVREEAHAAKGSDRTAYIWESRSQFQDPFRDDAASFLARSILPTASIHCRSKVQGLNMV